MSDQENQEQSQQIQWDQVLVDKFFQCDSGQWMPYNSSHINLSVRQYSRLYDTADNKQLLQNNQKTYSNKQHFRQSKRQYKKQNLSPKAQSKALEYHDDQKTRLTKKIQDILARRNFQANLPPLKATGIVLDHREKNKGIKGCLLRACEKRKRAVVNRPILEKAKMFFRLYNDFYDKPPSERITFKEIAIKLGVSVTEVAKLYQQYSQDSLFQNRMKKLELSQNQNHTIASSDKYNHDLNKQRLKFILDLIKQNKNISQREILLRINQEQSLLQRDQTGRKIQINRRVIINLMKMKSRSTNEFMPSKQKNQNHPQVISSRYHYVKRYQKIIKDPNNYVYYLGEFSFINNSSLGNYAQSNSETCLNENHYQKGQKNIKENIDMKQQIIAARSKGEDRWGRNLQYIILISLQGIQYYQIFTNICKEIDFIQTINSIGRIISGRNLHLNKYLVVQASFFPQNRVLQEMQKTYSMNVLILPPQNRQLNPAQYLLNQLKSLIQFKVQKSKRSYADVLLQFLQAYRQYNLQFLYSGIYPYVELALKQLPFR